MKTSRRPTPPGVSRRRFVSTGLAALASPYLLGCFGGESPLGPATDARLTARPGTPTDSPVVGESLLGLEAGRDGLLFVPESYAAAVPAPLLVLLHGAGGSSADWRPLFPACAARGIVVVAPDARGSTWDRIRGDFGPDVSFLDAALAHTFSRCAVDPAHVALAGFSDGASYALSLGVGNGDLFNHLMAFSPGFMDSGETLVGKPRIFVSHGTEDSVLSVGASREVIVPLLRDAGYEVRYEEFQGGHTVPQSIFDAGLGWFLA